MRKMLPVTAIVFGAVFFIASIVHAGECVGPNPGDDETALKIKIQDCQNILSMSVAATKPHEEKMTELQNEISTIEANVASLTEQIAKKKIGIDRDETKLATREKILGTQVRDYYKKDSQSDLEYLMTTLFAGNNVADTLQVLGYRQSLIDQEKRLIISIVMEVNDLSEAKKKLEDTQSWLSTQKASLEVTLAPVRQLVLSAKAYQSQLSQTVGALSARQQELIAARLGSLGLSRSAGISMACSDDRNIDPGFSPRLAFYTFGIPHRVGMNQFGAYGRATYNHEDYHSILNDYYNGVSFDKRGNININVDGYGSMSLEQYLLGVAEVPNSWPMDALKAQAVAARSYALAYTNNGSGSICTTQDCQVYQGGNHGDRWTQAVQQTAGEVMTNGGQVIKAWFSSTDGGYTWTSGEIWGADRSWTKHTRDTTGDVGSVGDLQAKAYDRDSPCFYNAQGWRTQYNKSAWLKPEEVADIVNVIMLSKYNNNWDTLSSDDVKSQLRANGESPFNRIDDVSMDFDWGVGRTTNVTLTVDGRKVSYDGTTFKNYFNVRAPANIAIVGPLFNIEKR